MLEALAPFLPLIGTAVGAGLNMMGQRDTNQANAQMAAEQMGFQERMSNTSYVRAVADMKSAGLNPMLAYSQGGASTPGGQTAVMGNELGAGVTGGREAALAMAELDLKKEQARNERLSADSKKFPAAVSDKAAQVVQDIHSWLPEARGRTTDFMEKVFDHLIPAAGSSASAVADKAVESGASAAGFLRSIPTKVQSYIDTSAERAERAEKARKVQPDIPPATRTQFKRRGTLGGAHSWDYGPDRR